MTTNEVADVVVIGRGIIGAPAARHLAEAGHRVVLVGPDEPLDRDDLFQRQSLVLGHSIYLTERFRVYGEVGYAFRSRVSEQWELQFGTEYAPVLPTKFFGSPFLAANGYLREEVNFGGTFTLQGGWSWRNKNGRLCRLGAYYSNGMSNQFVLHDEHEQQIGFGFWHDF